LVDNIIVVKFGGSCLSTPDNILTAAKKIAVEVVSGKNVVVVVSALRGDTDKLLSLAQESSLNNVSKEDLDEILSMGERTTVRLMATALKSQGLNAIAIEPTTSLWPMYTDSVFGSANVDLEGTEKATTEKLLPLLTKKYVPVVAGFLGLSPDGKVTTLGRGGSDVSAVILGRCLDADEVIFVKDVEGVFSADPKKIINPQKIDFLEAEEAYSLVSAGAQVIHPKALMYKQNSMNLRVVGFNAHNLLGGTLITGEVQTDLKVQSRPIPLSMITLVALRDDSLNVILSLITDVLPSNSKIIGIALTSGSILLYVENASKLVLSLHEMIKNQGLAKAIHCIDSVAMIDVLGCNLEQIPGVVDVVISPLAKEEINLYGVLTISSTIKIFIPWSEKETALSLINEQLNKFKNQEKK
jgi:aspartate kinase